MIMIEMHVSETLWRKNLLVLVLEYLVNMYVAPPLHDFSGMSAEGHYLVFACNQ